MDLKPGRLGMALVTAPIVGFRRAASAHEIDRDVRAALTRLPVSYASTGAIRIVRHKPIVMGLVYFGVVTPMAILAHILGKDFLRLRRDPAASTYWVIRQQEQEPAPERLRDQF